jgi:haloacetate dehalogenase
VTIPSILGSFRRGRTSVDLFPGFSSVAFPVNARSPVETSARIGGEGPPLLLPHGFPRTGVCWRRMAPALAKRFTLVIPDLRDSGASSPPKESGPDACS